MTTSLSLEGSAMTETAPVTGGPVEETFALTPVGRTALSVVSARAGESARPDRLFDDRLAGAFVRAAGEGAFLFPEPRRRRLLAAMGDYLAVRTRFFDDFLMDARARQVVLVAAGLDTRAFRLAWPAGVRLFELDRADVLDFKEEILRAEGAVPGCSRTVVRTDLRGDWAADLVTAGFRADEPAVWSVEGLLAHIPEATADALLAELSALSAPGSHLGIDDSGTALLAAMRTELGESPPEIVRTALTSPPVRDRVAWLATGGWRQLADDDIAELAVRYGRPVPPVFAEDRARMVRGGLVRAEMSQES
jgi:methyltransferase (TIGR00027 family)